MQKICSNNWKHDWFSAASASGILAYPSRSAEFVKCIILSVWKFPRHFFAGGKCEQITHDGLPNFPDWINQVYEIADSWIISEQKHWSIFNLKGNACRNISLKWFHYCNHSVGNEPTRERLEECLSSAGVCVRFSFPTHLWRLTRATDVRRSGITLREIIFDQKARGRKSQRNTTSYLEKYGLNLIPCKFLLASSIKSRE